MINIFTAQSNNMRLTLICFFFCITHIAFAQSKKSISPIDSILAKKISIGKLCLCKTTLSELRNADPQIQEVKVEEMDLCPDGFTTDGRFINGKGYYSSLYPGIIFQKDELTDYISKIRLTKAYSGPLPDGRIINVKTMLGKDVIKLYPGYDSSWQSRGCSDYWNLTNDTLSFFIKIDKAKQPQYPIDEPYYLTKPVEGIDLVVSCYSIFDKAIHPYKQLLNDPVFFIDSVNVTRLELQQYNPNDIALLTVFKGQHAIDLIGEQGNNGVIYIQTKKFARNRYWTFFKSKSVDYAKAVPDVMADSLVLYILNNKVLEKNYEGDLASITNENFISIRILDKATLISQYNIKDRAFGVLINTKKGGTNK